MTTKVVRVNSVEWKEAVQAGTAVYIGRYNSRHHLKEGQFSNRFIIGQDGDRATVIAKFEAHLRQWARGTFGRKYFRGDMLRLRGKVLGCWCKALHPGDVDNPCHGDVLKKLADMTAEQFRRWLDE